MKIAISAPTGNIGRKLATELQDCGEHELILLARNPGRLADEQARGATVVQGELQDEGFVQQATQGVDALFWLIPPDMQTTDQAAWYRFVAESGAKAVRANGIDRIVLISSIGAHLGKGVGPINVLREVEQRFREAAEHLTILRPTFFMENLLPTSSGIMQAKSVFLPVSGSTRIPIIATADIAGVAADVLLDPSWTGQRILPLHGPRDYSFEEVATAVGAALKTTVTHVQVSPEQARDAMSQLGIGQDMTSRLLELYDAIENGRLKPEYPRTRESTTPTTIEAFIQTIWLPMLQGVPAS